MTTTHRVHDDLDALTADAAAWFLARIERAQREGRTAHVALTGGSVSDPFHREVVHGSRDVGVDWDRVHWWWGDERFVGADSADRNSLQAVTTLLTPLGVPDSHVHFVASSDEASDVDEAATRYADELASHAPDGFEVVLLGLGPDGHVASLFPGHASLGVDDRLAVGESDSPKPPPLRVSLTFPALNRSRAVAFLAAGDGKADAVRAALTPGPLVDCPARGVQGQEETVWFLDAAAASAIQL